MAAFAVTVAAVPTLAAPSAAFADEEAPIKAGATLVARGDCELSKVTITRGSKVEVTTVAGDKANIVLPDGHVLARIPIKRLRYFFEVAR